ncbi:MAG: hypothetical protein KDA24_00285 [Deltaproteobacteria bacterium]|nr:hypothetical protein [Deltaproteobacteria bacterium]
MIDPARLLPVSAKVHVSALRTVAARWAARSTGVVHSPICDPITLVAGEATMQDAPDHLVAALCAPGLSFREGEVEHAGLSVPIGGLLIEAARLVSNPRAFRGRTRVLISEGEHFTRARHRLPLPGVTRGLLAQVLRTGLTLEDGLRAEGIGVGVVADDLAALVALQFIRIEQVPSLPEEEASFPGWSQPSLELTVPDPAVEVTRRLEREWSLFEESDDYAVLGLRPGFTEEQLAAASARMQHRYRSLAGRDDVTDEARALGRRLLERVQNAADRLKAGGGVPKLPQGTSGQQALRMGWVAMDEVNYAEARRWFQRGRRDPRTAPSAMAGLGWVDVLDPQSSETARLDGMELLRLAAEVQPGDARIQWLLVEAIRILETA